MNHAFFNRRLIFASLAASFGCAPLAHAADITFGVIGPHEYELPVNFSPFNVFVQYGDGNAAGNTYNGNGSRQPQGGSHTWNGLSKYVHFRSFDALPGIGFAFELIQAENFTLANGTNYGGLGTTIPGFAVWFKPNKHSTFGIQSFAETPSGTRDALSSGYWTNISSFIFDYEWDHFSFDGDLGSTVAATSKHVAGLGRVDPGRSFFSNLRLSWKATKRYEPFIAFDWQNTSGNYIQALDQKEPDSFSRETAAGIGLMVNFTPHLSLTGRFSHSIEGRNTPETNAYYMKFVYLW